MRLTAKDAYLRTVDSRIDPG